MNAKIVSQKVLHSVPNVKPIQKQKEQPKAYSKQSERNEVADFKNLDIADKY